ATWRSVAGPAVGGPGGGSDVHPGLLLPRCAGQAASWHVRHVHELSGQIEPRGLITSQAVTIARFRFVRAPTAKPPDTPARAARGVRAAVSGQYGARVSGRREARSRRLGARWLGCTPTQTRTTATGRRTDRSSLTQGNIRLARSTRPSSACTILNPAEAIAP